MRNLFAAAALAAVFSLAVAPAFAGECPAGKTKEGAVPSGPTAPTGVTDTVIGSIDLGDGYGVPGRAFRLRRLEIQPGGVVPYHSHGERPAHIYIVQGEVVEHRSNCDVPIVHKAGDEVAEKGAISHWWKNESKKKVVLVSADILPPAGKPDESM